VTKKIHHRGTEDPKRERRQKVGVRSQKQEDRSSDAVPKRRRREIPQPRASVLRGPGLTDHIRHALKARVL
jgi:hypothetical protein